MPLAYATILDNVSQALQDTTPVLWPDTENVLYLPDALGFISRFVPYVAKVLYTVESRTGKASSTSANHLVDGTKAHFLSTDVGKVIYNSTDKTWALIVTYNSTSDVTISKDIMASGESYSIFNKGCSNAKQIKISDTDYMWIEEVEFPVGTKRNVKDIQNDILEIDLANDPDDTSLSDSEKDAYVWVAKRHKLSQLTDLLGAVNNAAGYAAGATSMILTDLQAAGGTIEEGQEFTVANVRGTYWTTAAATIAAGAAGTATISFWPGLESAVANSVVVTFRGSTLTFELESIIVDVWAAYALIKKATKYIQEINTAQANLSTGAALINTITKENAPGNYLNYANSRVALGRSGDEWSRQGYLKLAQAQRRLELMAKPRKYTGWSRA